MFDCIIKGGKIIDGTGAPPYYGDVAIKDGKIAKIGKGLSGAAKVIDATGLVVTPGFIDSHSHADRNVLACPDLTEKIEQGITVSISGMCGSSATPLSITDKPEDFAEQYAIRKDPEQFFAAMRKASLGSGIAFFIGHGALRKSVMGMENRTPSMQELEQMKNTLRICMDNGAKGLSFGLYYPPGNYASTEEAVALAKVAGEYGGVVSAHIRDEGSKLAQSVNEFLNILKRAEVCGVVSHHKVCESSEYWGKVHHTLHMIDEANENGLDVYCDMYPYNATSSRLAATFLPPAEHARGEEALRKLLKEQSYRAEVRQYFEARHPDGDFSWIRINQCQSNASYSGRTIEDIAKERQQDPMDTAFDLILDTDFACTGSYFTIWEDDIKTVLKHPRAMICTDAGVTLTADEIHHPRLRGSFPRVLGKYVREEKITTLPEMIRKMTSMPARVYNLPGKGLIWEQMDADICIFDPDTIADKCWFGNCHEKNVGFNYVLLAGEVVAENAVYNGKRMAKAILK